MKIGITNLDTKTKKDAAQAMLFAHGFEWNQMGSRAELHDFETDKLSVWCTTKRFGTEHSEDLAEFTEQFSSLDGLAGFLEEYARDTWEVGCMTLEMQEDGDLRTHNGDVVTYKVIGQIADASNRARNLRTWSELLKERNRFEAEARKLDSKLALIRDIAHKADVSTQFILERIKQEVPQ